MFAKADNKIKLNRFDHIIIQLSAKLFLKYRNYNALIAKPRRKYIIKRRGSELR